MSTDFCNTMRTADYMKKLVFAGAKAKQLKITDQVLDRLNYELSVIEKLDLAEYFVIYSRIAEICNNEGILRSYGRGSASGSLVNYCLDITKINPLEEGLIFERFLNPEISKWADIDIDVPIGAQKVIVEKLKAELPEYTINYIAHHSTKQPNNYQKLIINDVEYDKHPCAVIISREPLPFPTYTLENDTHYVCDDYYNLKELLEPVKFDILELYYLNKLDTIWKQIGKEYHPYKLNLNDGETFEIFRKGDTSDIFQCTTDFNKRMMPKYLPENINDLAIFDAMHRPGPMEYIYHVVVIKRKGFGEYCGSDPRVRNIMLETHGWLIFQETFFRLAHEIAGFSYQEADTFRRVLYIENDEAKINEFKLKFVEGCRMNSTLNEEDLELLMGTILILMPKTFIKSHALCYMIIAYWGAYFKAHFRSEFDAAFGTTQMIPDVLDGSKTT